LKKRFVSFEVDERFEKFLERRSGSLGINRSEMIRNAILFDAMLDCDGEAFEIVSKKVKEKSVSFLRSYAIKLGIT